MSQFITEKIKNHHVKLKPSGNIYRISEKTENGIVAYYSACPLYRSDGTYIRKQFDGKGIFKGINASVYLGKKQIILQSEKSNFVFDLSVTQRDADYIGTKLHVDHCGRKIFPTLNGFALETENDMEISFRTSERMYFVNLEEYCLGFNHNDELIFSMNCICHNAYSKVNFETESDGVNHRAIIQAEGKMIVTLNAYAPKSMFDTPLLREAEHFNHVYAETVKLTNGEQEHWLLLRPDCEQFSDLMDYEVESARLYFRDFNGNGGKIESGRLRFLWCAFTTTWESREIPQGWESESCVKDGYFEIDMTDYYRGLFRQKLKATPGFVLRASTAAPILIPTGDNYLEPIITELRLVKSKESTLEEENGGNIKTNRELRI